MKGMNVDSEVDEDEEQEEEEEQEEQEQEEQDEDEAEIASMNEKLLHQLRELKAEHTDLIQKGRVEDAAFIATQIKELEQFVAENTDLLKEILGGGGDSSEEDDDMDVDKKDRKRKFGDEVLALN